MRDYLNFHAFVAAKTSLFWKIVTRLVKSERNYYGRQARAVSITYTLGPGMGGKSELGWDATLMSRRKSVHGTAIKTVAAEVQEEAGNLVILRYPFRLALTVSFN